MTPLFLIAAVSKDQKNAFTVEGILVYMIFTPRYGLIIRLDDAFPGSNLTAQ